MIKDPILSAMSNMALPAIPGPNALPALAMQFQLDQTQWLSEEELEQRQLEQLRLLLSSARTTSPYYKKVIPERLPKGDLQEVIRSLPILSRLKLQQSNEDIHANIENEFHRKIQTVETSGTTGTPVKVGKSHINGFLWNAFALRDHYWHQRDFSSDQCLIRWAEKQYNKAPQGASKEGWGAGTLGLYKTGKSHILNIISTTEEQVLWLQERNPAYILSFPSNLKALAEYCIDRSIQFEKLREIRTVGETVKPGFRDIIKEAWGVKVTDIYTCEEAGYIAIQCPDYEHYHVQSENMIVEILNKKNEPCQIGEIGRVFITALNNFATPLIRYELGDLAEWGESCSCGRGLPVVKTIHGRERNRLKLPDGTSIFPYTGDHRDLAYIIGYAPRQFQIVQEDMNNITLRFAVDRPFTQAQEDEISAGLLENLGQHFKFKFEYPEHIPNGPRGKYDEFICKLE